MRGLGVTPLGMGCRRLRDPEETPAQEPASDAGNSRPCGRSASRVHLPAAETTQPPGPLRMTSSGYASLSVIRVSVPPSMNIFTLASSAQHMDVRGSTHSPPEAEGWADILRAHRESTADEG